MKLKLSVLAMVPIAAVVIGLAASLAWHNSTTRVPATSFVADVPIGIDVDGLWTVSVVDSTGNVRHEEEVHNHLTPEGRNFLADILAMTQNPPLGEMTLGIGTFQIPEIDHIRDILWTETGVGPGSALLEGGNSALEVVAVHKAQSDIVVDKLFSRFDDLPAGANFTELVPSNPFTVYENEVVTLHFNLLFSGGTSQFEPGSEINRFGSAFLPINDDVVHWTTMLPSLSTVSIFFNDGAAIPNWVERSHDFEDESFEITRSTSGVQLSGVVNMSWLSWSEFADFDAQDISHIRVRFGYKRSHASGCCWYQDVYVPVNLPISETELLPYNVFIDLD